MSKESFKVNHKNDLNGQKGGIFSVDGIKCKLVCLTESDALFSTLQHGKYLPGTLMQVLCENIEDGGVYKIGFWKKRKKK